ncbi:MAG TPA: hypothetical protein PLT11_04415 [Elusimicrobiota bacterium]|nr:hypothetical protein [Elusimicrobiota bacterium]
METPKTTEAAPVPLGQKIKRALIKYSLLALLAAIGGSALWVWGSLTYVYSSGERAGYVQKISKKGWVIKTWEGELAMVNLPGAMPEKFVFTVREESVARRIQDTIGQRVALSYQEHRGLPGNLFGDTRYFVINVGAVDPAPTPADAPRSAL